MDFRDWLLADRHRHVAALERIDEQLAQLGGTPLPKRTPAAMVAILEEGRDAMSPGQVATRLRKHGRDVSDDAVYAGLSRLARADTIERVAAGKYRAKTTSTT